VSKGIAKLPRFFFSNDVRFLHFAFSSHQSSTEERTDIVLAAEELRNAVKSVARITSKVDVEDVLDLVFSEFCIGK